LYGNKKGHTTRARQYVLSGTIARTVTVDRSGSICEKLKILYTFEYTSKDAWRFGRQMSHLSVETKLDKFFTPALLQVYYYS
jgi:hypothetical protein